MTKEEYIKDLIAQGMTMEQIKPLADAFIEQEETVEEPQEEIIEEVKTEVVADQTGATVTTTPEQASEIDTELQSEDGSSELLIPEEELLKINEKVNSLDLNTSVEQKRTGGKFSQTFNVDVIPYEEQRIQAEELLKKEGKEINEQSIQDQTRLLIIEKEKEQYNKRKSDEEAPGLFSLDTFNRIKSTAAEIYSGTLKIPSFVNKAAAKILFSDELAEIEKQNAADPIQEAKEINDLINNSKFGNIKNAVGSILLPSATNVKKAFEATTGQDVNDLALDISDNVDKYVEKLDEDIFKYKMGVGEMFSDAVDQGDFSGFINALSRTTKEAVASLPYMAVAALPGGLGVIGGSTAAGGEFKENSDASKAYKEKFNLKITDPDYVEKKKQLDDRIKNGNISLQNLAHHTIVGTANSVFERYSAGLAKNLFKTLKGQSKNVIDKNLKQYVLGFVKDSGGEGLTEGAQTAIEKASNLLVQKKEIDFNDAVTEVLDAVIVGSFAGAGPSSATNGINIIKTGIINNKENKLIKDAGVSNAVELFEGDINNQELEFARINGNDLKINAELDLQVENGQKTIEEANNIKQRYRNVQKSVNQIKPLGLSESLKPEVVSLLLEKDNLSQEIKSINEPALTQEQSTRVKEIDKQLNDIVVKDKTTKIDVGAKAVAEQLEVGIETFDTTEDTAGAIETLKNQGGKVDIKNSTDYGTIVEIPNDQGGIDTQIIINKQEAAADNVVTTSQHEVLHAVLSKTTKGNPDATIALGKSLLNELRSDGVNLGGDFEARLDQYVKDPNISEADVMEEVMTLASEGLTNGEITINESTLTKIGNAIKKFFGLNNLNIRFNTGKDVLNFIRDYNKSVQKGKGLSKSQLKVAKEGAKGKLIDNAKTEIETIVTKQSKSPQGEQASAKVQEIYDAKGKDGAFEIIEQFEPIVSRIVEKRSEAPNFDRQLLTDEINTGKRGIIDLVAEYKPESGVPLAAYINKFLPARAIEASQRVLGEEFTTDVTEARGVIAEETKQPEAVVSRKVKKPSETTVFDKATETRIDEAINKNFKGEDVKFSETKNIPKEVADIYAESLGINPETIVDKRRNYSKKDAEGLTKAKQLLLKNAKDDYARLPELKDDFGKGTFVPKNVKDALYTDGKLTGSLKDYMDLIREKPVKPIYRDRVGQTIRGLLNLTIRNRILETAQPLQAKRLQSGAKFSKKTGVQQQQINTVKKYGVTPIDQTAEGTSRVVDFVENELPKAFGNLTNLIAKSSNLAGAGNSATTEKGGGALGRGFAYITNQNKTRSKDKLKTKELLESEIVADLEISRNKINKKGFGLKDADKEAVKLLNLAIGSQKGKAKVISNQKLDDKVIDLSKKEFYDGIKKLMKNDRNNIAALQFILGNQNANSGLAKNLATLNNDATQKGDKSYEEHWFQTSQFVSGLIKSLTKGTSTLNNFIKFANKNYYQEIISKETQGIVDKSYDITLDNGDVVKWKSQNENHPLLVKALDKAIKTNEASDWAAADKLSDLRKYPGPNIHSAVNPFLHGRNGISDAVRYGINVSKIDQSNVNIQYAVNSVIHEVIVGDITSKQASARIEAYLPIARLESKASKKNTTKFGDKVNNEMTVADQLTMLGVYDKAASLGRKLDTPKKGISVFDFDDTLAETKEKVIVNNSDGTTVEISAAKFAEQASELQEAGATFDFSNFENVGKGTQKGPLADLALRRQGKFGSKDIFVLTARPQIAAEGIKKFLDGIGLSIPLANITGLEDGSPGAKGNWIAGKAAEGYNDFYFADDAYKNVQAVQEVLSQIDVNSVVQIAKSSKKITFDKIFNDILESSTGIKSYKEYSAARAQTVGANKGKFTFFNTPSAEDFTGLLYKTLGKGKVGDAQMAFYKTNLLDPYNRAELAVTKAKITAANDFKALKRNLKTLPKSLSKQTGIGGFTFSQAARVAAWTRQDMNIPGLSKRDIKELNDFVNNDAELNTFVDELIKIQKGKPYPKPGKNWLGGTITSDILNEINKVNRKAYLQEWQENVDIIFSDKNMNKLEAAYGPNYVEALRDQLARMKSGSNRPIGGSRVVNNVLDWLNNSVGAVMFLNTRSAVLQTLSSVNFINFGNNNIYKAGKAFANQPQFWKDFKTLMNSPYLVERRNGLKINVSESEIADAVAESSNKPKAAISYLLNKGFIFTRIADSFAIAAGGSAFYRNQIDAYVKDGMDIKEAEKRAFDDFYAIAEESQQSSNPSKISQQQASGAGRVILAFANTPMQYARIIKRSSQDLINKRGDWKSNVSKIVFYAAIQNIAFNALQSALFAEAFGEDEEEDEKQANRQGRIANGMADSLLRGLGIQGAAVSALKNSLMTIANENDKKSPKFVKAVYDLFDFSPPLDSKFRKLRSGANTITWERENIKNKGFDLNNPAYLAGAQVISGLTNLPLDRAIQKINNIRAIISNSSQNWQKVAMALGWSTWDLGLPYYGVEDKVEMTPQMILKEKVTVMKKETNTKQQKETLLKLGLTKQQIKDLKYEEARVKKIIELQEKNKKQ